MEKEVLKFGVDGVWSGWNAKGHGLWVGEDGV
jgi:hypothetical protein